MSKSISPSSYEPPAICDYGDLVEMTATVGGGFSDVPQGSPIGTGCVPSDVSTCFSK
jgi:hypothetical protein